MELALITGRQETVFWGEAGKNRDTVLDLLHLTSWSLQLDTPGRQVGL